jgi:ribosomal protein S18 acetylase RimI-like enzyme
MINDSCSIEITRATTNQVDTVVPLFDAYRVFYDQPSDPAGARAYLLERLKRGQSIIFLATDRFDNVAAGFTQLYPTFSSVSMRAKLILYDLFVMPEKRRRGVGRALMEEAGRYAKMAGYGTISLSTAIDNFPGQSLYESLGYKRDEGFYHFDLSITNTSQD